MEPYPPRKPFPSDVSDVARAFVAPYLTLMRPGARVDPRRPTSLKVLRIPVLSTPRTYLPTRFPSNSLAAGAPAYEQSLPALQVLAETAVICTRPHTSMISHTAPFPPWPSTCSHQQLGVGSAEKVVFVVTDTGTVQVRPLGSHWIP